MFKTKILIPVLSIKPSPKYIGIVKNSNAPKSSRLPHFSTPCANMLTIQNIQYPKTIVKYIAYAVRMMFLQMSHTKGLQNVVVKTKVMEKAIVAISTPI